MTKADLKLAVELYFATGGQAPGIVMRDYGAKSRPSAS
jgi:hypothetical protein